MVAGGFSHYHCPMRGGNPTKQTYAICTPWVMLLLPLPSLLSLFQLLL
jgi:hypothetical protein